MKNPHLKVLLIFIIFMHYSTKTQAQEGQVTIDADKDIDKLLEFKKDIKTVDLYKIRIYSGDRSGAESAKSQANGLYGEWPSVMEYETPNYKIYVGNFLSRLEADRALL
ncbi:MAG: SPOR domain-containing protein, partial [Aquaticitalea sp.]